MATEIVYLLGAGASYDERNKKRRKQTIPYRKEIYIFVNPESTNSNQ